MNRPTYPDTPTASIELWVHEAQRSLDWARDAREEAKRLRRRENIIGGLLGLLALMILLITIAIIAATAANT